VLKRKENLTSNQRIRLRDILKDALNKWSDFQRRFLVFHQVEFHSVLVRI
jgi:hypothetical protein